MSYGSQLFKIQTGSRVLDEFFEELPTAYMWNRKRREEFHNDLNHVLNTVAKQTFSNLYRSVSSLVQIANDPLYFKSGVYFRSDVKRVERAARAEAQKIKTVLTEILLLVEKTNLGLEMICGSPTTEANMEAEHEHYQPPFAESFYVGYLDHVEDYMNIMAILNGSVNVKVEAKEDRAEITFSVDSYVASPYHEESEPLEHVVLNPCCIMNWLNSCSTSNTISNAC